MQSHKVRFSPAVWDSFYADQHSGTIHTQHEVHAFWFTAMLCPLQYAYVSFCLLVGVRKDHVCANRLFFLEKKCIHKCHWCVIPTKGEPAPEATQCDFFSAFYRGFKKSLEELCIQLQQITNLGEMAVWSKS